MRFKQFLEQQIILPGPRTIDMGMHEAFVWIKNHAPKYAEQAEKHPIFRGMKNVSHAPQYGDTSTFNRKSSATANYYTLMIDSSSRWSDYPSRASAFVGSSGANTAHGYGHVFIAFPDDHAKVGICPRHDMWQSFKTTLNPLSIQSLRTLNEFLEETADVNGDHLNGQDAKILRRQLQSYTVEKLEKIKEHEAFEQFSRFGWNIRKLISMMKESKWNNLEEALENILDPETNAFKHCIARNWYQHGSVESDIEVWFSGKVVFIPDNWLNNKHEFRNLLRKEFGWT